MAVKKGAKPAPADSALPQKRSPRVQSEFPKNTLEEALRVPRALYEANGGQPLPPTETAIALGMSPGSSDFRVILSSSIKYGLTHGSFNSDRITMDTLAQQIVEPKNSEEAHAALVEAALTPETFRQIYEYFRGKKLPEPTFFQNTVVREFNVPRGHAERCVAIFNANMEQVNLVRVATSGRWLSTEAVPPSTADAPDSEDADEQRSAPRETGTRLAALPLPAFQQPTVDARSSAPQAIFLGHGKNKQPLDQLKGILDQYRIPYKIAIDEPNQFRPISQKVAETMKSCGAAILIFTADEEFRTPAGEVVWRPSENVIYELGAASVLYESRIIIFKEDDVHFPANFRDIGYISFEKNQLAAKTNELFRELIASNLIKVVVGS
jgi:Predicted nucleotide-binding protein containing TIR-like domain.